MVKKIIEYNEKVGLVLFCLITSKVKNHPFEIRIINKKIDEVVLAYQIKSLDWNKREDSFITKVTEEVINKIVVLIINSDWQYNNCVMYVV